MAVIDTNTDERYWVVTDTDPRDDGKFDVNLKQVADYTGAPLPIHPAPRKTITRAQNPAPGTIVKVTDVTTVDRTIVINPTA